MDGLISPEAREEFARLQRAGRLPRGLSSRQLDLFARSLGKYSGQVSERVLLGILEDFEEKIRAAQSLTEPEEIRGVLADLGNYLESDAIKEELEWSLGVSQEVAQGAGRHAAQHLDAEQVAEFPGLELVRHFDRDVPRGFKRGPKGTLIPVPDDDWPSRWEAAGGKLIEGRMCALKGSPVWQALGDGAGGYTDTLGNPFPPFAFNSGYMTEELSRDECEELGLLQPGDPGPAADMEADDLFADLGEKVVNRMRSLKAALPA